MQRVLNCLFEYTYIEEIFKNSCLIFLFIILLNHNDLEEVNLFFILCKHCYSKVFIE